jgi:hypothetical protein
MKKLSENMQIFFKSLIFAFLINAIEFLMCFLCKDDFNPFLLASGVLFIIGAIFYFLLKRNIKKRWRYLVNMVLMGLFWGVVFNLLTPFILESWSGWYYNQGFIITMSFIATCYFMISFFAVVCFIDLIYNIHLNYM